MAENEESETIKQLAATINEMNITISQLTEQNIRLTEMIIAKEEKDEEPLAPPTLG